MGAAWLLPLSVAASVPDSWFCRQVRSGTAGGWETERTRAAACANAEHIAPADQNKRVTLSPVRWWCGAEGSAGKRRAGRRISNENIRTRGRRDQTAGATQKEGAADR